MDLCCHRFTAAEGGARLAAAAAAANTLVTECGAFIATRLTHEEAYNIRGLLSEGRQRSIHISRAANVKPDAYELSILTDLKVTQAINYDDVLDWRQELETKEVLVCSSEVFRRILQDGILEMTQVNILVIDSCHRIYNDENLQYIMQVYKQSDVQLRPRILAITFPLFDSAKPEEIHGDQDSEAVDTQPSVNNAIALLNTSFEHSDPVGPEKVEIRTPSMVKIKELGVHENLDDFEMYEKLEYKIEELEKEFCCKMDFAEDIDGCKRISGVTTKPKEILIEYTSKTPDGDLPEEYIELDKYMKYCVCEVMQFLEDHRHDPTEIYGDELYDEFKSIPDPSVEPRQILKEFMYVLEQLGPYAADKAAFSLLVKLEKLKIKVPYERHFLLLRLCTTIFVKIRCFADIILSRYDDWDRIRLFSTPKLLRLVEILDEFTPPDLKASIENGTYVKFDPYDDNRNINANTVDSNVQTPKTTSDMLNVLEQCDFTALGNKIEDRLNVIEGNLKELDDFDAGKSKEACYMHTQNQSTRGGGGGGGGGGWGASGRRATRVRARRGARARTPHAHGADALCGVVFVKEPLMAKILFMCVVDISRARPSISYINSQYCAVESTAGFTECQKQGRRHEEVLKKFRMHECNLLLTTSALEEGIDLPRCNLVLRWDIPPSYRSYVLCRNRARAARSGAATLSASGHTADMLQCLSVYKELDQIITRKCGCGVQDEPPSDEEAHADSFNTIIKPYTPSDTLTACICNRNRIKKDIANSMKRTISDSENEQLNEITEYIILDLKHMNLDDDCDIRDNTKSENVNVNSDNDKCLCNVNRNDSDNVASVDLDSAIALINRYCAKLPSDTFTRLTPQWWIERVRLPDEARDAFICTLRLPLNCPVKYNIVGHPMPTRVLARRVVALQACRILHKSGELDHQLMPIDNLWMYIKEVNLIGKENFKAMESDSAHPIQDTLLTENDVARPGTTKRRQYYYKRTSWAFTDCQPVIDTSDAEPEMPKKRPKTESMSCEDSDDAAESEDDYKMMKDNGGRRNMLYAISSSLWCALPERYNTRGRRLHAPQHAGQALAILMARERPTNLQIPAFPVYTRSGEVRVSVEHVPDADVRMSPSRCRLVRRFMQFVFTEVLRVRRRGMALRTGAARNDYYIVPTLKTTRQDGSEKIDVDWGFLEEIYNHTEKQNINVPLFPCNASEGENSVPLKNPLLKDGEVFVFEAEKYMEAVVTPWYRNQDQPQFFLVAEICSQLTPDSAFPSDTHETFRSYYQSKYKVELTQTNQPLLDVDHTSARLNLLTPRYVNRKGVALPVSSERTRRAKRDRLDQKQILVPELCTLHPFAAPLWFATVALPCVLYRINALLIADEIRRAVAIDVGLGVPKIDESTMPGFQWPPLDFGWCLAEVLSADAEKTDKKLEEDKIKEEPTDIRSLDAEAEDTLQNDEDEATDVSVGKTINDKLQEEQDKLAQEDAESGFEIGTWSNDMASSIPDEVDDIYDEWSEPLPPNLTFCTSANGGVNWCDPVKKPKSQFKPTRSYTMADSDCSYLTSDFDSDDSEFDVDNDTDAESGFGSSKAVNASLGVRIEYKTAHEAEAVDVESPKPTHPSPQRDPRDEKLDRAELVELLKSGHADVQYIEKFRSAVEANKHSIMNSGLLVTEDKPLCALLPDTRDSIDHSKTAVTDEKLKQLFPYKSYDIEIIDNQICIESIERNKRILLGRLKKSLSNDEVAQLNCFFMKDIDIDAKGYVNEKVSNVGFDSKEKYAEKVLGYKRKEYKPYYKDGKGQSGKEFDFDYQPDLDGHPGPSPSVILQALTMSNANDGINLERLETIGDSFLKFAITAYLYCAHPTVHEGKLSHMRSKQVSNLNLYRLGVAARLGARMVASKFEPHDNWLPPCHRAPPSPPAPLQHHQIRMAEQGAETKKEPVNSGCYIPYNLITQHSIPDKSIADCVEALIGAYLLECGPRGALLFMAWLGISVLPHHRIALPTHSKDQPKPQPAGSSERTASSSATESEESEHSEPWSSGPPGARKPYRDEHGNWYQIVYGELKAPPSPLLRYIQDPEGELERMLSGYDALENTLHYRFNDRSLLLQALTHASHQRNTLTDCYQRLEFLGDAILDYLITRHLYEDPRRHSPGALTDLRSALVNNTIFATLAVRHGFHKYFRHMSPGLNEVLMKYVKIQEENGHSISEEHYLIQEDELEQAEDVEVPKALGDLFESIAGAIFLDSGMSLGAVWAAYVQLMGAELEAFSAAAPKSPVRELLEAEPDTAKFSKPERLADGRRVRVCVEVFGRGTFKGVGRNYRIAKGTAARCALRHLKKHRH